MSLPSWPQKANKIRRAQKHLRWLDEMKTFAAENSYGDLLDTYDSAAADLRFIIAQMRDDRVTPNSPSYVPGNRARF